MQKAKLELPVKQFHQLYDLLGHVLDHDAEAGYLDLDNLDIKFLDTVRNEMFNQIPDEATPIETTYAYTVHEGAHYITPIKLYKTKPCCDGGFLITNDRGSEIFCIGKGCSHLSSDQSKNWKFLTITND
jgi:hypothetical protein